MNLYLTTQPQLQNFAMIATHSIIIICFFAEQNKNVLVLDLFGAGSGTTSNTLSFALLYLCKQPEIQKKLQAEIDKVVGQSRQPVLDDRKE